jgi:hypothetical protein
MISVARLAGLPLFADESRQVVSALARRGIEARFAPNEVMFLVGSEPRDCQTAQLPNGATAKRRNCQTARLPNGALSVV